MWAMQALMQRISAAVPAVQQIDLLQALLQSAELSDVQRTTLTMALAESLEAAGRSQDSLEAWKILANELKSQPHSIWTDRVAAAIDKLSLKQ